MEKNLGSTKEVTKRAIGEKINVRDCQTTYATESVELVLWGTFADNIVDGWRTGLVACTLKLKMAVSPGAKHKQHVKHVNHSPT